MILNPASQKLGFLSLSFHNIWRSCHSTSCFVFFCLFLGQKSYPNTKAYSWLVISQAWQWKSLCFVIYFTPPLQGAACDSSVLLPDQGTQCLWLLVARMTPGCGSQQLLGLRFRLQIWKKALHLTPKSITWFSSSQANSKKCSEFLPLDSCECWGVPGTQSAFIS